MHKVLAKFGVQGLNSALFFGGFTENLQEKVRNVLKVLSLKPVYFSSIKKMPVNACRLRCSARDLECISLLS